MASIARWKRLVHESYVISNQVTGRSVPPPWKEWLEAFRLWLVGF